MVTMTSIHRSSNGGGLRLPPGGGGVNGNGSSSNNSFDEKYRKRRKQTKEQRFKQAFTLLGVAMVVLIYTWYDLLDADTSDLGSAGKNADRNKFASDLRRLQATRKRKKAEVVTNDQQEELDDKAEQNNGLFGGVKKMFTKSERQKELEQMLEELETKIQTNANSGIRWVDPGLLPALKAEEHKRRLDGSTRQERGNIKSVFGSWDPNKFFKVKRKKSGIPPLGWEKDTNYDPNNIRGPLVDYTKHQYAYPQKLMEPPATLGDYPKLIPFKELMERWPQDDIDHPPTPYPETLIHFDYSNPEEVEAAIKFRDAKLPFKFINVPEVVDAGELWTDEYLTYQFDDRSSRRKYPPTQGTCQESSDNFFAFFVAQGWPVERMGVPPTRNNDWTFQKWSEHAKYADSTRLNSNQPHFYWQAGIDREERHMSKDQWTFVSRDLPSFSSPTKTTFVFNPEEQKGIQCRFGERGVSAATHFDSGRNMIAMVTGAKRYILSPPKECSKLAIINNRGNAIFRHSM